MGEFGIPVAGLRCNNARRWAEFAHEGLKMEKRCTQRAAAGAKGSRTRARTWALARLSSARRSVALRYDYRRDSAFSSKESSRRAKVSPAPARFAYSAGSASRRSIAATESIVVCRIDSSPVRSCPTSSGMPPTSEAITGFPAAKACGITIVCVSCKEGTTTKSNAAITCERSSRHPVMITGAGALREGTANIFMQSVFVSPPPPPTIGQNRQEAKLQDLRQLDKSPAGLFAAHHPDHPKNRGISAES